MQAKDSIVPVFKKEQCKLARADHCDAELKWQGSKRCLALAGGPDQRTMVPVSSSHLVVPGYNRSYQSGSTVPQKYFHIVQV